MYFSAPELYRIVRSRRMKIASVSFSASISAIPFSSPRTNTAVDRPSALAELSVRIVTDASVFCTGHPVAGSSRWWYRTPSISNPRS